MKRVVLVSAVIFVFTLAFGASLMAVSMTGYGRDNVNSSMTPYLSMTTNDLTSMQKEAQKFVGQPKDQLVTQKGKPEAIFTDKSKDQIYRYEVRLDNSGPSRPHWLEEDFVVGANGTVVRVTTSTY